MYLEISRTHCKLWLQVVLLNVSHTPIDVLGINDCVDMHPKMAPG